MTRKEQTYKMGTNWIKHFLDAKKLNSGWKSQENPDGTIVVFKPGGKPFALYEPETGLVHTTANIMQVQW